MGQAMMGALTNTCSSGEEICYAPLPAVGFDLSQWSRATVNIGDQIAFDGNFYSVPYAPAPKGRRRRARFRLVSRA